MDSPSDAPYLCTGYERFSSEFALRLHDTIHDSFEWANFHTCAGRCMMRERRVPFFHGECFWFRLYAVSDAFVDAGQYTFEASKYEEHRRFNRIRILLTSKLRDVLQIRLLPEILTSIAGLLVRECATITAEEHSQGTDISDTFLDLSLDVYATYCIVDGVRYIKSLANTTSELYDEEHQVLVRKEGKLVHKIWIAEDHRAIRFVRFYSSGLELPGLAPTPGLYWRAISALGGIKTVTIKTDGVKIRDILVSDETVSDVVSNYVGWTSPEHPTDMIDLTSLGRLSTTGYTVITRGHSVITIHAHGHDDDSRFYAEMDDTYSGVFLNYMPLDDGEFVTEICRRFALTAWDQPSFCLVFITNKGRSVLFGTSGPADSCQVLDRFFSPAPDGSRIFFNDWKSVHRSSIEYLAFDDVQSPIKRPFPPSLVPKSPYFWTQSNEPWFVSSCSMEGIVEMTLCRDVSVAHKPILGMLLEYKDGHRDRLGQFRYDKFVQKVQVDPATEFYIGSRRTVRSFLYVADVLTSPPRDRGTLFWMKVPQDGTIDWWSSLRHSIVRHTSTKGEFTNMAARTDDTRPINDLVLSRE